MATATYVPLATQTLGSAASSITFSSIPSGYTDLRVVLNVNLYSSAGYYACLRINGDTTTTYSNTWLYGNGTSAAANGVTGNTYLYLGSYGTGNVNPYSYLIDIFSYTGSTYKTVLNTASEDRNGAGNIEAFCGLWRSTAAITSLTLTPLGANFNAGTTATLWGI
jgi:hypothetical protein